MTCFIVIIFDIIIIIISTYIVVVMFLMVIMICPRWLDARMDYMSTIVMAVVVVTSIVQKDVLSAGMVGLAITQAMDVSI